MTFIAKPAIDDSEVLNHIARDLVIEKDGNVQLKRSLRIATGSGVTHEISFAQADGLLNILDSTREVPPCTPLQYLIDQYNLSDLVEMGKEDWLVPEYRIVVMGNDKVVRFEGKLTRYGYEPKEFTYALGGFDFIQQFSLARCISMIGKEFEPVYGTFDCNYAFISSPDGLSVSSDIGI